MEEKIVDNKDKRFAEDCNAYKAGWTRESEFCIECSKSSRIQYNRCKKFVEQFLKECFSTDKQIKEYKNQLKGYSWK